MVEAGHCENVLQIGIETDNADAAAFGFGVLQHPEKNTQTARRDILKFRAIEHDSLASQFVERLNFFFGFGCGGGVETAFENGSDGVALLLNFGFHIRFNFDVKYTLDT